MVYIVGDFGLATSSLAAVDPSDVSLNVVNHDGDMTLGLSLLSGRSYKTNSLIIRGWDAAVYCTRDPVQRSESCTSESQQGGHV